MQSAPSPWCPLVAGETAAQAIAAAEVIAADLAGDPALAPGPGLNGQAGLALFYAYLELSLDRPEAGERAQHHLDRAIAELAEQQRPASGLFHGFAGLAWTVEHLTAGEISDDDEDPNTEIDAALLSRLRGNGPWQGEFDLLGGLVGWGVYALERRPHPAAEAISALIVERLAECAERGPHGVAWRDPRHTAREPDPGMAHGSAGVIALVARMLQEGAVGPEAVPLLTAAVEGVLDGPIQTELEGERDLAWCAGDAGLSIALLAAGRACGREDWERTARSLATAAAARYPEVEAFDPALCHGAAGLSHLFHRLYLATGDPVMLATARRWFERTLAQRRPDQGIGGYLCRGRQADGRPGWIADPGFLGGAAGIGLALLAAATPMEPAWDRLLLLSGKPGGKGPTWPCDIA